MTNNNTFSYTQITPVHWQRLTQMLQQRLGLPINARKGHATSKGFCFEWKYCPLVYELKLTCINKPVFVSADMIRSQLDALIDQSQPHRASQMPQ